MTIRGWVVLVLILCAAVGLWFVLRPGTESQIPIDATDDGTQPAEPGPPTLRTPAPRSQGSTVPTYPSEDAWLAALDPKKGLPMGDERVRGIVVDPAGRPVFDARVYLRGKPDQPAVIDDPHHWSERTDKDGRFVLTDTWAARSVLCAWAPGYERACVEGLTTGDEVRVVLEPSPPVTVVVHLPAQKPGFLDDGEAIEPRVRVLLMETEGSETPRPDEALRATWEHLIEPEVPTPVRIPRGVPAHITVDARDYAADPPFAAVPNAAKEIVFRLVPSADISLRLVDAKSGERIDWSGEGASFHRLTHVASGFALEPTWTSVVIGGDKFRDTLGHDTGVAVGTYRLEVRHRGYVLARDMPPISVERPGQHVQIDVPLVRDMTRATLHVVLRHGADTQRAGAAVEGFGPLFLRRQEDAAPAWKRRWGIGGPWARDHVRDTLGSLAPGTYDVLAWDGTGWTVGHHAGLKLEGGAERTLEIDLLDGYGFRPSDIAALGVPRTLQLRAECEVLGVLPWLPLKGHPMTATNDGFVIVDGKGYIGPYPFEKLTIVERPPQGRLRRHVLEPSISPPDLSGR